MPPYDGPDMSDMPGDMKAPAGLAGWPGILLQQHMTERDTPELGTFVYLNWLMCYNNFPTMYRTQQRRALAASQR